MRSIYSDPEHRTTVNLMELKIGWLITGIEVNRSLRGQGHASRLLRKVLDEADKTGTTLLLTIDPDGTGMSSRQLKSWYHKLGFKPFESHEESLVRTPNTS